MKYDRILLILFDVTRNTGNLEEYFVKNTKQFFLYLFPATFVKKEATLIYFENGKVKYQKKFGLYQGTNKIIKSFFHFVYYCYIVLFILPSKTKIITYQVLYCIGNSIFNLIKKTTLIFCIGDFFPIRTDLITKIYHNLTVYYNKNLNYVLYPSFKFKEAYKVNNLKQGQLRDMIFYGIKKMNFKKTVKPNLLGYVGNLREGQGVELILDILKKNKNLKLEIMGEGILLNKIKKIVSGMNLINRVKFLGFVDGNKVVHIVKNWQLGLAPYDPSPAKNMTFYADPSKIKFYLQYQLPVIMTKVTYIADEIEQYKAGICIDYTEKSLEQAIYKIQHNQSNYLKGGKI